MQIEIWSDIMCPFCYIGKSNFEKALEQFTAHEDLQIIWRSYQLAPNIKTDPSQGLNQLLASLKNISIEQAKSMNDQITDFAASVGLTYHLEKTIPANTLKAHQLLQLAKKHHLQNEMEEALFKAYFTDGENIDHIPTLIQIGVSVGLNSTDLNALFEENLFLEEIASDIYQAQQVGVTGVPFFVFNNKQAISGAQPPAFIAEILNKSYQEYSQSSK